MRVLEIFWAESWARRYGYAAYRIELTRTDIVEALAELLPGDAEPVLAERQEPQEPQVKRATEQLEKPWKRLQPEQQQPDSLRPSPQEVRAKLAGRTLELEVYEVMLRRYPPDGDSRIIPHKIVEKVLGDELGRPDPVSRSVLARVLRALRGS